MWVFLCIFLGLNRVVHFADWFNAGKQSCRITKKQDFWLTGSFWDILTFEIFSWNRVPELEQSHFFRKVFTSWKKLFSPVEWNWGLGFFNYFYFFLPDSLEGYFWSQAYDSMPYQTTLKTKIPSSQESCYCLTGQSVATANVTSSIGCGGVWKPTEF